VLTRAGHIYILPSAQGWTLLLALLVMLVGAINYAAALAYALVFLVAGVLLVAPLHTQGNLLGLSVRLAAVPPAQAGGVVQLAWSVSAVDDRPRPGLELVLRPRGRGRGPVPQRLSRRFALPAGQAAVRVEIPWPAGPRGRLALPRLELATRHPLGLFRAWAPLDPPGEVLVWPACVDLLPPPAPAAGRGTGTGGGPASGTEEFRGLEAYKPGDPPRRIAWRAWRPGLTPPVKHFDSAAAEQHFAWEHTASLGDTERRLSQLAAWVLAADRAGDRYGLRLPGRAFAPASGRGHREAVMAALALYGLPA
jgi:uncharacterized protein (DUF58 family)